METYDSEQDPESERDLESDHKGESDQDLDSEEELRDVGLDTPHKKSQSRPQKPRKKVQRMRSLKGQLGTFARVLEDIQAQMTLINQQNESQMISTERLGQQMEDVNQELLAQREKTQYIEDHLHKRKGYEDPLKPEKEIDADDEQTTESDNDESDDDEWHSNEEQRQPGLKKLERRTLKPSTMGGLRRKVRKSKPVVHTPLTAEAMSTLIKQTVAGEFGIMHQRIDQMDKGKLPYFPDLGSEELPLPYTEAIMLGKTSKNTKFQKIDLYDGSTDPYDHLDNFRSAMDGKDATEADRCKAFPQTLKGSALNWFRRIPAGTIRSFGDMRRAFLDEFMIVSNRVYTPNDLTQIRQLPDENLRDYVIRFQGDYHRCEGADEKIAYAALMGGFRSGPFLFKIMQDPPGSFKALMREATNYSRAENLNCARDMVIDPQPAGGIKRTANTAFGTKVPANDNKKPRPNTTEGNAGTKPKVPLSRYGKYTPLVGSKSEIFAVVSRDLPEPKKIRPPTKGRIDESLYCRYHREYGHTLEKCVHLADAYQALIDKGAPSIQRFIKRDGNQADNPRLTGQETRPNNPRAVIHTISGGPTLAGNSNKSRKAYARSINADIFSVDARPTKARRLMPEPIIFTDEDGEGLVYPHHDPIIITALIADCEVARVLIDGGSAVNIISAEAFAKLRIEPGMLSRGTTSLTAYGGTKIHPIGHMPLTLSLGTWPNIGTCTTLFVISDCPSAYNVILGRPALGDLMARVSYCHLTLKFPTSSGVGKVRGDQALARACYAADSKHNAGPEMMDTMTISSNGDHATLANETVPTQVNHVEIGICNNRISLTNIYQIKHFGKDSRAKHMTT